MNDTSNKPLSEDADRLAGVPPAALPFVQLGSQALRARRPDAAEGSLRTALAQAPGHPEIQRLLGVALRLQNKNAEALKLLRLAAERWPDDVLVQNGLGTALDACGEREAAISAFRRACELAPGSGALWANLGKTLGDYGHYEEAVTALEHAARLSDHSATRMRLAYALRAVGRIDDSVQCFRQMLARNPADTTAWLGLAGMKTRSMGSADMQAMQRLLQRKDLKPGEYISLEFALAKALEDHGRYAEAFAAYARGNTQTRAIHPWSAPQFSAFVDQIMASFRRPLDGATGSLGEQVIFIVSLPRSGSSLTEQILASHPQIDGAGELDATTTVIEAESRRRGQAFPQWVTAATAEDWQRMGHHYLAVTSRWQRPGMRFTDKLPGNWSRVGAIFAMLPGARVIDCRRDPLESCFSCFRTLFSEGNQPFSYALGDIAAYWRDYDRSSRHWQALYPQRYRVQSYESLVADPENQVRELLDFCGVPFDAACLRSHETRRSVRTASASQIREPIRRDTARTNKYGALLDPLRKELGLPPFAAQ
ncbi:MAG: sulfotransferase [Xanthomonadaceae bacterium]|nr:sulfotransferase [Xanthomonadaceae bacterium]